MTAVEKLINRIKQFNPKNHNRDLAILRIHYSPEFFSKLLVRKTDSRILGSDIQTLAKDIFGWFLTKRDEVARLRADSVATGPARESENISVSTGPISELEERGYQEQALIIAREIWALNQAAGMPTSKSISLSGNLLQVDGKSYPLKPGAVTLWGRWLKTNGEPIATDDFPNLQLSKVIEKMPSQVRKLIKPGKPHYGPSVPRLKRTASKSPSISP